MPLGGSLILILVLSVQARTGAETPVSAVDNRAYYLHDVTVPLRICYGTLWPLFNLVRILNYISSPNSLVRCTQIHVHTIKILEYCITYIISK